MLKLKKVELQGFKSFCDRTELRFNGGGIAAVVGPNGCGKSNLSDAISWVLGEQSARSLRGARMEDVIFAGTKARKPVGMASVTMVLVDPMAQQAPLLAAAAQSEENAEPASAAPESAAATQTTEPSETCAPLVVEVDGAVAEATIETAVATEATKVQQIHNTSGHGGIHHPHTGSKAGEITITRRLFRSGESEYLIDGRQARLRDIQDIFMGSGLGPESYAIIEQGRIGQILSSKPQDRRAVLEEAAGITRYKSRRRLAEAKLESSKQNLSRVFDILEEVTRQVNSLKRQAAKAKRYGELKGELEGQLRTVLAGRYVTLKAEAEKSAALLEVATAELKDATIQAADKDAERQKTQEIFYALEAQLTEARQQLSAMSVEAERTKGRLESQAREAANIEQRMARAEHETGDLEVRLAQNQTERAAFTESVTALEAEMQEVRTGLLEKNRVRDQIQLRVREAERTIEASRSVILRLLGEASSIKNQLAQAETYLAGIERERTRVQRDEELASAEIARLTAVKQDLTEKVAARQREIQTVISDRKDTEEGLADKRREAHEIRQRLDQLRAECSRLRARRESIENILSHHSYTTESTKKLLTAIENGRAGQFRPEGVLADFVEVDPKWERAVEEFLTEELEYVVVKEWNEAEKSLNLLRAELEGRATFLVDGGQPAEDTSTAAPADLPRLTDFVSFSNGLTGQTRSLLPRLANCYLAADREQARNMADAHPTSYFLLPDGESYHGRMLTGGRKKSSGPLVLKRELRDYDTQLKKQEGLLAAATAEQEALQHQTAALEANLERLRQLQQAREKDAVSLDHEQRRATEEINRANSRVSVSRQELERLKREEERAHENRARNQQLVEQKDAERTDREQALEALRDQLEAAQAEFQGMGEEHAVLRAKLAGLEERHRGERAAMARLEHQFREMSNRSQQITTEMQRWGENRARILNENIGLDQKLTGLSEQIVAAERTVLEMAQQEARFKETLAAGDEVLRELRVRIEAGHKNRSEIEIELTRRQSELQFLDETSRKELNLGVAELEIPEDISPEVLQVAEQAYQETKTKIENLGAVNPTAWEEFQEAQQRFDFLSAQRQDLLDSIRDTEKAIREIDEFSRNRFSEAFKVINENFRQCFQTLFGGGTGEMRLTDEENINECGIDIIASPPGKKLQNVLLLSGGEKALTALSLLMAIFKYQPSPFCVLDEVDAPLDEANIGRLTRLLTEMAVDTQFIVITHSKKTMESAQAMYGVTMQEAGVSKLVSVRFHHNEHAAA